MSSSSDENMKNPLEAAIRELVAKGEVSEDVLHDSDTIIRWWRSLDPTKQEEIKNRAEELSQGVPVELLEKKTITKMEKTWKPTVAAILMWITIFTAGVVSRFITDAVGIPRSVTVFILAVLPMFGGYYALRRRRYNWALTGSICSILSMPLLGIPAVILLINSKHEFHIDKKMEKKPRRSLRPRRIFVVLAAIILLLVISIIIYAQVSTPTPEPSLEPALPESSVATPIQTVAGDLVIEVDENGLSINNNRFDMDSTLDDYIKVIGNPSRVTELMNTIHTYDDIGIMLYHPPHSNRISSVSIDYVRGDYAFSPKHVFSGNLVIGGSIVQSTSSLEFLKSIDTLILEDSSYGVYSGHFGDTTLIFEYLESTNKLDGLGISFSKSTTSTELTLIEEGWVRLIIRDVGSIDYPSNFLELQSGVYRDMATEFHNVLEVGQSDFTLQQIGLNEVLPTALNEYRRVLFKTVNLNPDEVVLRANENYIASREDLAELKNELVNELYLESEQLKTAGMDMIIVDAGSLEIIEINKMFPIVHTYKRQIDDNPLVLVKHYIFQNYNKIHHLFFSYRVVDEEECRDIYERILYSFRLE